MQRTFFDHSLPVPASLLKGMNNGEVRSSTDTNEILKMNGLNGEDLETMSLTEVSQLGTAFQLLNAATEEVWHSGFALTETYQCKLGFLEIRGDYLGLRACLSQEGRERPILENSVFLGKEKPALLGITNLAEALILVLKRQVPAVSQPETEADTGQST